MRVPRAPANEPARLSRLHEYRVLDTSPEPAFDALTRLAAHITSTPLAFLSLVDSERQWFKSRFGTSMHGSSRELSFCGHVVESATLLVVADASKDDRFADNPLVTSEPWIRFYAGAPLQTADGLTLGTLCVVDHQPRSLDQAQTDMLLLLAQQVVAQLELRRNQYVARERELIQQALLDSLPGLYFHLSSAGTFLDVHGVSRQHLYAAPSEFIGKSVEEVLSPEAALAIRDAIVRTKQERTVQVCRYQLNLQGQLEHFEARIALAIDGSIVALVNQITEMQEQKQLLEVVCRAQTSFLASAEPKTTFNGLLGDLLELTQSEYGFIGEVLRSPDGAPYLKTHAITNIAWDDSTRHFYEEHAAKGLEFHNLKTLFGTALTTGRPVISNSPATDPRRGGLPHGHPPLNAFLGLPLHSGEELIGLIGLSNRACGYDDSMVRFLRPLSMTIARLLELLRSNRAKTAVEQLIRERENHFRSIVDTAIDAIITIDECGIIRHANPAMERLFGYSAAEVIGKNVSLVMPSPERERHDGYLAEYKRIGQRRVIGIGREVTACRKNGEVFPAELAVSEFYTDGVKYFTGVIRDLSDRKRIERLQSEFVSTVSHELRTPLTSIRGSLGLVAAGITGELPKEAKEYVDIAVANSDRLVRLINDILDIEKMESGKMEFRFRTVDLGAIVRSCLVASRALAAGHGVRLVESANWPLGEVLVDPDRLAQVLSNLISNAVKFSPADSEVEVSLERRGDSFRVSLRDHGPGISSEFRQRIFQRFAQGDGSSTRRKGGTGLGLAISKSIIEKMHGHIDFEAAPGRGSVFFFELPFLPPVQASVNPPPDIRAVLVCEDEPAVSHLIEQHLASLQFVAHVAPTLERARRLLATRRYDVATLDLELADGNALQLVDEIRGSASDHPTPIVVVTGSTVRVESLPPGISTVVAKPFDRQRLLDAVTAAVASQASMALRLLHVEDDRHLRKVVKRTFPGTWVIVEAGGIEEARQALAREQFDIVLLDLALPDGFGQDLLGSVGNAKVVVFSASEATAAVTERAAACLVKSHSHPADVRDVIRALMAQPNPERLPS